MEGDVGGGQAESGLQVRTRESEGVTEVLKHQNQDQASFDSGGGRVTVCDETMCGRGSVRARGGYERQSYASF